jgi:heavy metal sensor kinase
MTTWWSSAPIRVRLTVWYTGVLALLLAIYAAATFVAVRHEFREQLEEAEAVHGVDVDAEQHLEQQLGEILFVLAVGFPAVLLLAGAGGYALARRALSPIDQLATEARRITAERLHERLTVPNDQDEIGRLAAVINDTFARLESSFERLRRFTSDASHELRTPLSVIRGVGEMGLRETRTPEEYQEALSSMLEEVDRLTRLVDTLLRLSRADAGTIPLARQVVDLGQVTQDVAGSLAVAAEERQQRFDVEVAEDLRVYCDPLLVREALANVVDNAIKYGPIGSPIAIRSGITRGRASIVVADSGPGIAPSERERIFDRFYRIDEARSRETGGTGLGLAIAKWAVEANGGRISLEPSDRGSVFQIEFPLANCHDGV